MTMCCTVLCSTTKYIDAYAYYELMSSLKNFDYNVFIVVMCRNYFLLYKRTLFNAVLSIQHFEKIFFQTFNAIKMFKQKGKYHQSLKKGEKKSKTEVEGFTNTSQHSMQNRNCRALFCVCHLI